VDAPREQPSGDPPPAAPQKSPLLRGLDDAFRFLRWAGLVVLLLVLGSGIRVVGPDEVALVIRMGALVGETRAEQVHGPGLLFALPYLVDRVVRVPVKRVQSVEIREIYSDNKSDYVDMTKDGYLLTGDRNVIVISAVGRYRITDPVAYALRVAEPRRIIHDAIVTALTAHSAESRVDDLLGRSKRRLAARAVARAQRRLAAVGVGVQLVALELTRVQPPRQVAAQFRAVHNAYVAQKTAIDKAQSSADQRLLMAQAHARKTVRDARAFGKWRAAKARGDASAFARLAAEVAKHPDVRERLYREAMARIFQQVGARVVLPAGAKGVRVRLPAATLEQHAESWGIAGSGLYWDPRVVLRVAPDGAARAQELSQLLQAAGVKLRAAATASHAEGSDARRR